MMDEEVAALGLAAELGEEDLDAEIARIQQEMLKLQQQQEKSSSKKKSSKTPGSSSKSKPPKTPASASSVAAAPKSSRRSKSAAAAASQPVLTTAKSEAAEIKSLMQLSAEELELEIQVIQAELELTEDVEQLDDKELRREISAVSKELARLKKLARPAPVPRNTHLGDTASSSGSSKKSRRPQAPKDAPGDKLFCVCQKPHVRGGPPMIRCDLCDEWYHLSCLGMVPREAELLQVWVCFRCMDRDPEISAAITAETAEAKLQVLDDKALEEDLRRVEAELKALTQEAERMRSRKAGGGKKPAATTTASASSSSSSVSASSSSSASSSKKKDKAGKDGKEKKDKKEKKEKDSKDKEKKEKSSRKRKAVPDSPSSSPSAADGLSQPNGSKTKSKSKSKDKDKDRDGGRPAKRQKASSSSSSVSSSSTSTVSTAGIPEILLSGPQSRLDSPAPEFAPDAPVGDRLRWAMDAFSLDTAQLAQLSGNSENQLRTYLSGVNEAAISQNKAKEEEELLLWLMQLEERYLEQQIALVELQAAGVPIPSPRSGVSGVSGSGSSRMRDDGDEDDEDSDATEDDEAVSSASGMSRAQVDDDDEDTASDPEHPNAANGRGGNNFEDDEDDDEATEDTEDTASASGSSNRSTFSGGSYSASVSATGDDLPMGGKEAFAVRKGDKLRARCAGAQDEWLKAQVLRVRRGNALVHFVGRSAALDEWVVLGSGRLAPLNASVGVSGIDSSADGSVGSVGSANSVSSSGRSGSSNSSSPVSSPRSRAGASGAAGGSVNGSGVVNNDACSACGLGGDLLCCDGCPKVYHGACLQPPVDPAALPANAGWYCSRHCKSKKKF